MAIKKWFMFVLIFISLLTIFSPNVNALDFDNVKSYDLEKNEVKIKNVFGLGRDLFSAELTTPHNVKVIQGEDRKVAEFKITQIDRDFGFDNAFQKVEFYDIKKSMDKINRDFTYKLKVKTGEKIIPIYEESCKEVLVTSKNGTLEKDCSRIKTGEQIIDLYNWKEIKGFWDLPLEENLTIGVFTEVKKGDYVEWIPNFFGVEVEEWASWTESLNQDIISYWNFNETSGDLIDIVNGTHNGTLGGSPTQGATGKIGYGYDFQSGDSDKVSIPYSTDFDWGTTKSYTFSGWFNSDDFTTDMAVYGSYDGSGLGVHYQFRLGDTNNKVWTSYTDSAGNSVSQTGSRTYSSNLWQHFVVVLNRDTNNMITYINGTIESNVSIASLTNSLTSGTPIEFGTPGFSGLYFDGTLDEFALWERALTGDEAEQLYNNGDGLAYNSVDPPTIALNNPSNYSTSTTAPYSVDFNLTANDDVEVANLSLIINGVINETVTGGGSDFVELFKTIDLEEGSYYWYGESFDDGGSSSTSEIRTIIVDSTPPVVEEANNLTNLTVFSLPTSSNWNFTSSDTSLQSCFYHTSINATNITVTCNSANIETNWTTTGNKGITYCANDTFGFETCRTNEITVALISYFQNDDLDPIGEGGIVNYTLELNLTGTTMPSSNAYLVLNNTVFNNPTIKTSSNRYLFSYPLTIPEGLGNTSGNLIDWYWNYSIDGFTTNASTTSSNTTIYEVDVDDCSSYGEQILNLSLKDEETTNFINETNIEIDLTLSNGSSSWTYSKQWTDENNVGVCVPDGLINNTNYTIDFIIGFDATDHVSEFYYLDNGTLSGNSELLNEYTNKTTDLYDLATADSTSFLFNYFDEDGLIVDNIIVHTFRKYIGEGVFNEVERSKQNDDGNTVVHLVEEDVIYYFVITQNGQTLFTSNTYTALCQSTPCEIQLEESGGFQDFETDDWDLIENGAYILNSNSLTREVNLTYTLTSSSTMNLTVYKLDNDGSYDPVGSQQSTGTSGDLIVSVPTVSGNTTFFATVEQDGEFKKSAWINFEEDAGIYFGNTLSLFLGALIILALGLLAVSEGSATIIFLLLGMFISGILGVVDYRTSTGLSILIYFIIAGGIIIWKITRRTR